PSHCQRFTGFNSSSVMEQLLNFYGEIHAHHIARQRSSVAPQPSDSLHATSASFREFWRARPAVAPTRFRAPRPEPRRLRPCDGHRNGEIVFRATVLVV